MTTKQNIFENCGTYASKWGITDFYEDDCLPIIKTAFNSEKPFYASWGAKKEIVYATAERTEENGKISLTVSRSIDELFILTDTLVWSVTGKNENAGSGFEALQKRFPDYDGEHIETILEELEDYLIDLYQEDYTEQTELEAGATFDDFLTALSDLEEATENASEQNYKAMQEETKEFLKTL